LGLRRDLFFTVQTIGVIDDDRIHQPASISSIRSHSGRRLAVYAEMSTSGPTVTRPQVCDADIRTDR
jgi:hypothetical protein